MKVAKSSRTLSTMDKKKLNNVRSLSKPLPIVKGQPVNLKNGEIGDFSLIFGDLRQVY
jgi:hypothetical protein